MRLARFNIVSHLNTRPYKEGIKTRFAGQKTGYLHNLNTRPYKEGIKIACITRCCSCPEFKYQTL